MNDPHSPDAGYITPGEASRLAHLTLRTLARLADRGEIDCYTLPSGHRRYSRASIERLTGSDRLAG